MATNVKPISSRENPLLVRLRKLARDPAGYRKLGSLWVEGEHLCAAAVHKAWPVETCVITEPAWSDYRLRELASHAQSVAVVPQALMAGLSTLESPAELAFALSWPGEGRIEPSIPSVVLDRLQDTGNVGTVLRSAAAFGFMQVIALKGTAALWSPKVLRAGMGAHFSLNLVEGVEEAALGDLKAPLLATSSHAPQALHEASLPWPCSWVMGHEGQGVSPSVIERCAMTLRVPQPGGEESLNVAAAASVCLYESMRQRVDG